MDFVVLLNVSDECRTRVTDLVAKHDLDWWQPPDSVAYRASSAQRAIEIARIVRAEVGDGLRSVFLNATRLQITPLASVHTEALHRQPNAVVAALAQSVKDGNVDQVRAVYGPVVLEKLQAALAAAPADASATDVASTLAEDILETVQHDCRKRSGVVLARTQL